MKIDLSIVRGLAYYTGVVFEVFDRGAKLRAIAGGGRYDNLIAQLSDGAVDLPALGFAMGDVVLGELIKEHARGRANEWQTQVRSASSARSLPRDREGRTPRRCACSGAGAARRRLAR